MAKDTLVLRHVRGTGRPGVPLALTADFGTGQEEILAALAPRLAEYKERRRERIVASNADGVVRDAEADKVRLTGKDFQSEAAKRLLDEAVRPIGVIAERPVVLILGNAQGKAAPALTIVPSSGDGKPTVLLGERDLLPTRTGEAYPEITFEEVGRRLRPGLENRNEDPAPVVIDGISAYSWNDWERLGELKQAELRRSGMLYIGDKHYLNRPDKVAEVAVSVEEGRSPRPEPRDKAVALMNHFANRLGSSLGLAESLVGTAGVSSVVMGTKQEAAVFAATLAAAAPLRERIVEAANKHWALEEAMERASAPADPKHRGAVRRSVEAKAARATATAREDYNATARAALDDVQKAVQRKYADLQKAEVLPQPDPIRDTRFIMKEPDRGAFVEVKMNALKDLAERAVLNELTGRVQLHGADPDASDLAASQARIQVVRGTNGVRFQLDESTYHDSTRIEGARFVNLPRGEIGTMKAIDIVNEAHNGSVKIDVNWVSGGAKGKTPILKIEPGPDSPYARQSKVATGARGMKSGDAVKIELHQGDMTFIRKPTEKAVAEAAR